MGEGGARLARGFPGRASASARIGGYGGFYQDLQRPNSLSSSHPCSGQKSSPLPPPQGERTISVLGGGVTAAERATNPPRPPSPGLA